MKKSKKHIPKWLENEPKISSSAYTYFGKTMREKNADEWVEKSLPEVSKIISQIWKTYEKKDKVKGAFQKVRKMSFHKFLITKIFSGKKGV